MTARPVLLVYGNCQAEALVSILGVCGADAIYDVAYLRSFSHPQFGRAKLDDATLGRVALLWQQHDYEPFPYAEAVRSRTPRIVFPAMDLNVMWPFSCENPYNTPEPPEFPYGRYNYGDRTVVAALGQGCDAAATMQRVVEAWEAPLKLDRLLEIERARLRARDAHCDVRMTEHVLERFRQESCFFTRDHPRLSLLLTLLQRLIARSCAFEPRLTRLRIHDVRAYFPVEPLADIRTPIHPRVAELLGLRWYEPEDIHAYYSGMIEHGIRVRDGAACTP
jgi:hypothetical protein